MVLAREETMTLNEVTMMAMIIKIRNTTESRSPLVVKISMKALKEPVTKVIRQKIMSRR